MRGTIHRMMFSSSSVFAAFLFISSLGWATDYYVSPKGLDSNPGTASKPWKTIAKAASTLQAGDTVYVGAGIYREHVVPRQSGSPGRPITYMASPADTVILDGLGIELPDDLAGIIDIDHKSWIALNGFHLLNAGPHRDNAGIMVKESSDITIKHCSTSHTISSGIGIWASARVTLEGCRVELACTGGFQESITVAGTDGFEVRGCWVSDCRKEGICLKDGSSYGKATGNEVQGAYGVGIYVDAWDKYTHDIEVYGNRTHDNDGNGIALASEMGGMLEKISIHDNLSYHNRYIGIHISTNGDSLRHPMRSISVVNNTCVANGWEDWGGGIALDNTDARDVLIRNNICSSNRYFQLVAVSGIPSDSVAIDHNLIHRFGHTEGEVLGAEAVEGDPLFTNPAKADFHLRAGSPAIDAGIAEGAAPADFDGRARFEGAGGKTGATCDIGVYEL